MKISQLVAQRQKYLPCVFLIWAGIVGLFYFYIFPFPEAEADNPYPAYGLLLWISVAAITTGATLLQRFRITYRSKAEKLVFSAGLGFALIAYLVFGLGISRLLYPGTMYAMLIVLTLLSYKEIRSTLITIYHYLTRPYHPAMPDFFFGAIIGFLLLYHFLGTLVPPVFFDSLVYHLAMPRLYTLHHAIIYYPYNFFSNFPFTLEMLYTLGLLLQGSVLVKGLNYMLHLLMLAGLYSFARTYFTHRVGIVSVTIFYTIPWVGITSFLLYVDIGLGCYFWLAMYAFINWVTRKESGWITLCGVFTGVMLGIKYLAAHSALILGFSVLGVLTWRYFSTKEPRTGQNTWRAYRPVFRFALPAFLVASPWYIKNLIWTGNPVYPFLFGGREWDIARMQSYVEKFRDHTGIVHGDLWAFLRVPWHLTFPYESFDISIGPIILIFLPLLLFMKRVPGLVKYLLVASLLFFVGWVSSSQQFRFLIPIFPFMSLAAGYAITEGILPSKGIHSGSSVDWIKTAGYLLCGLFLLSNVAREVMYIQYTFTPLDVIMGLESKQDYLSRQLPTLYPITRHANDTLPPEAKILYIGETRGYYSERPFIASTAHDETPIVALAHEAKDADDLREHLKTLGVTHIIFNRREGTRLHTQYQYLRWKTEEDGAKFWEFYRTHLKRLHVVNDSELLEIRRSD